MWHITVCPVCVYTVYTLFIYHTYHMHICLFIYLHKIHKIKRRSIKETTWKKKLCVTSGFIPNCSLVLPQEPKLAFEDVDATELYPCVMFYSSNPGEKVRQHKCSPVWEAYFFSICTTWGRISLSVGLLGCLFFVFSGSTITWEWHFLYLSFYLVWSLMCF